MHPTFSHPLLGPPLHNLLFIHLSVPWGKAGKNFFLKLSSRQEMLRWHADLTERASSKSSATEQRRSMRTDSRAPDPEMAPGYELTLALALALTLALALALALAPALNLTLP